MMTNCEFRLICTADERADVCLLRAQMPAIPRPGEVVNLDGAPYVVHAVGWAVTTERDKANRQMPSLITAASVACAILAGDHHLPRDHAREIAAIEAEAFVASLPHRPHVSILTVLAVAYVESRFSPTGSARDLRNNVWGVMQILAPRSEAERLDLLDPAVNIRIGVGMLETAWVRAHGARDWVGAYFWGSVPTRHRALRAYRTYAGRVRRAERAIAGRLERCAAMLP